ncbi:acyclic terpene utilization AtuA family protein [Nocardioides sp.]|uniref:acyclic terpene utilization AtuA family protein n=1 Tax=Nocardioides sp. TaxID=35761 RepID=UPI0039E2C78E
MIRIGNCSGFYGDRLSAMREMLEGGPLDVLTGDYLAELTMLILGRDAMKDPAAGYARTFVQQAEDCLGLALEKGVKIVSNAGGLNPAGLAARLAEIAPEAKIAYVEGDKVETLPELAGALTANAYLGGWGIARALAAGADVVVTGRVTDASLVVGPAAAHFGWAVDDWDRLAGAVVAGHVIECGTQATGGNFSGFATIDRSKPLGFPVAEIAADGSSVITKHRGTGGAVTVDTVTAQLMYEIQGTDYLNPDVTTDLASIELADAGEDRVGVTGVRGGPPPATLKVAVNELGGMRNSAEFVLTGLDIEEKADWLRAQVEPSLAGVEHAWSSYRLPEPDSATEEGASVLLRLTAWSADPDAVGKRFTEPLIGLALASYPGFHVTAPPSRPSPYGVYRAEYVERAAVQHLVVLPDGTREVVPDPTPPREQTQTDAEIPVTSRKLTSPAMSVCDRSAQLEGQFEPGHRDLSVSLRPLGEVVFARSGDKGGDANLGLWVPRGRPDAAVDWLIDYLTRERVRQLVPEAEGLEVDIHPLANLRGVNVVIHGLLGAGVAEGRRFDPQAKALGEWVRSRYVDIPEELL